MFRHPAVRFLPWIFAGVAALLMLWASHLWGLAVFSETVSVLDQARGVAASSTFSIPQTAHPVGPLWPIAIGYLMRAGLNQMFALRVLQAFAAGLLLFVSLRFLFRHVRSKLLVASSGLLLLTLVFLSEDVFVASPVLIGCAIVLVASLTHARYLLEDSPTFFVVASLLFGVAALFWSAALVFGVGAVLATLIAARGNFSRRLGSALIGIALSVLPVVLVGFQTGVSPLDIPQAFFAAVNALTASLFSDWIHALVRVALLILIAFVLGYIYVTTRGPGGIGPALKRRELQLWMLLSIVWILHLVAFPLTDTLLPLFAFLVLIAALCLDSMRDFSPVSALFSYRSPLISALIALMLALFPTYATVVQGLKFHDRGDGLLGFDYQTSEFAQVIRQSKLPRLSDNPSQFDFTFGVAAQMLPDDIHNLSIDSYLVVVFADSCPSFCEDKSAHSEFLIEPLLTSREGMLYKLTRRPEEPALATIDSLTIP